MLLTPSRIGKAVRSCLPLRTRDKPEHGAYHVDARSMLRRVQLIVRCVAPKSPVLLVGDDDLTSVCLHRLGFSDLTVVDFDAEVLGVIERATRRAVRGVHFDLRAVYSGKRPRLGKRHRLFLTDPPYGKDGLRVFAGVGLEALAAGGIGIVVCPSKRAPRSSVRDPLALTHSLERFVLDSGATIVELVPDAQRSYHGTVSSLLVAQKHKGTSRVAFGHLDGPRWFY